MADVVDEQNAGDRSTCRWRPSFDGEAFRAAHDLVFEGLTQPSGYTEPILHPRRARRKRHRKVHVMTPVTSDQARAIIAGPSPPATAGFKPLTVVVLDAGGHVIAVEREDGSSNKRFEIAHGKAHGALALGMGSRTDGPGRAAALLRRRRDLRRRWRAGAGAGRRAGADADGDLLGAVGVSGDTSDNDEAAAVAGIERPGWWPAGLTCRSSTWSRWSRRSLPRPTQAWPMPRPGGGVTHGETWVRVRLLDRSCYAEYGGLLEGVQPVFVTVLERHRPTGDELSDRVARVTAAVADVTGRDPENVHVLYEDDAAGRLSFGGRLVE